MAAEPVDSNANSHSDSEPLTEIEYQPLLDYVNFITQNTPRSKGEDDTTEFYVEELFSFLGWRPSVDFEQESSRQIGSRTSSGRNRIHIDIIMHTSTAPTCVVETKRWDKNLEEKDRKQLFSYLRQTRVPWGILTNGQSWEVYVLNRDGTGEDEYLYDSFTIDNIHEHTETIRIFEKDRMESGESQQIASRIMDEKQLQSAIQSGIPEFSTHLEDAIKNAFGVTPDDGLLDEWLVDAITDLEYRVNNVCPTDQSGIKNPEITDFNTSNKESEVKTSSEEVTHSPQITATELREQMEAVGGYTLDTEREEMNVKDDGDSMINCFLRGIKYLFDEGYMTRNDLPYIPMERKRLLVPEHPDTYDNTNFEDPRELVDGVWIDAHARQDTKVKRLHQIAQDVVENEV